jgi:hypothetical protein
MRASRKMWLENQRAQSLKDRIVDAKEGANHARLLRKRHCAPRFTVLRC